MLSLPVSLWCACSTRNNILVTIYCYGLTEIQKPSDETTWTISFSVFHRLFCIYRGIKMQCISKGITLLHVCILQWLPLCDHNFCQAKALLRSETSDMLSFMPDIWAHSIHFALTATTQFLLLIELLCEHPNRWAEVVWHKGGGGESHSPLIRGTFDTKMWDLAPDFGGLITGATAQQRGHITGGTTVYIF